MWWWIIQFKFKIIKFSKNLALIDRILNKIINEEQSLK